MDFTLKKYSELINSLKKSGYKFERVAGHSREPSESRIAILRHDVDRMPKRAFKLAQFEADHGVQATYYFRAKPCSFDPEIMKSIESMGHEVGYHYETLCDAKGNHAKAWELFQNELDEFRKHVSIQSISMHGRPLSPHDSRDLWKTYQYSTLGLSHEAYYDIDWKTFLYFTDTGRSWNAKANIRDHLPNNDSPDLSNVRTTDDLIKHIHSQPANMVISTHPERWTDSCLGWSQVLLQDFTTSLIKLALKPLRSATPVRPKASN